MEDSQVREILRLKEQLQKLEENAVRGGTGFWHGRAARGRAG